MLNGRAMKMASRSIETNCRRAVHIFFLISKKKKKKTNLQEQHSFCLIVKVTGYPVVADF